MRDTLALDWLAAAAQDRAQAGLVRQLVPRTADRPLLDLASNDYLGLSADHRVIAGARAALDTWGAGSTGSRLVTGTTELHLDLERALSALVGAESGLVFSSGYLANVGAITALAGVDCLIVADSGNHASLVDGCRLSRSRRVIVAHGDLDAAAAALAGRTEPRALVVLDAISSVDGDLLALAKWHHIARTYGALLLIDDAHGLGIRGQGRGSVYEAGLAAEPDVITTVTLSKALAAQGGAVLGSAQVIEHLSNTARSFIFDTALNPAAAGAALAAVAIIAADPLLAKAVLARAAELAEICSVPVTDSAVVPVLIGSAAEALRASLSLRDKGIAVGCFRPPSVPVGTARLRITARADLSDGDLQCFSDALATLELAR